MAKRKDRFIVGERNSRDVWIKRGEDGTPGLPLTLREAISWAKDDGMGEADIYELVLYTPKRKKKP